MMAGQRPLHVVQFLFAVHHSVYKTHRADSQSVRRAADYIPSGLPGVQTVPEQNAVGMFRRRPSDR